MKPFKLILVAMLSAIAIMAGAKLDRVQDIVDTLSDIVFSERRG